MEPDTVRLRIVLRWAPFCLALLVGANATGVDKGKDGRANDAPAREERPFLSGFRTLVDCVKAVARDRRLATEYAGTGSSWDGWGFEIRVKERFAVVADKQKFPFLGDGLMSHITSLGRFSDNRNVLELRRITLDLDTGELRGPDGVDMRGLRILDVRLHLALTQQGDGDEEFCQIDLSRKFPEKNITVSITSERRDGQAFCREFLKSLESRLREVKEKGEPTALQRVKASTFSPYRRAGSGCPRRVGEIGRERRRLGSMIVDALRSHLCNQAGLFFLDFLCPRLLGSG
jgi:hypothetical protein